MSFFSKNETSESSKVFAVPITTSRNTHIFGGSSTINNPFSTKKPTFVFDKSKLVTKAKDVNVFSNKSPIITNVTENQNFIFGGSKNIFNKSATGSSIFGGTTIKSNDTLSKPQFVFNTESDKRESLKKTNDSKEQNILFGKSTTNTSKEINNTIPKKLFTSNNSDEKLQNIPGFVFERHELSKSNFSPINKPKTEDETLNKEKPIQENTDSFLIQNNKQWTRTDINSRLIRKTDIKLPSTPIADKVVLHCKKILPKFNKRDILLSHFQQFGHVEKIITSPMKHTATVRFLLHKAAYNAKRFGTKIDGMKTEIEIVWGKNTSKRLSFSCNKQENQGIFKNVYNIDDQSNAKTFYESPVKSVISKKETSSISPFLPSVKYLENTFAQTSNERFQVLDAIDKHYRITLRSKSRIGCIIGTCPDMCPEKERYFRHDKRRLSIFEMISGTDRIDHAKAVKEYSRSSADQEMPLPHELRPVPVLEKTMNFLLQFVFKLTIDQNCGDWYDFLWNRTRAIRKDITQQQFCDKATTGLVEKCARFHIYCSHRLCEQDSMVFDFKINNENLTKCLQTLKELYKDLHARNIFCDNESEFRSYMVLMNLNNGDCLIDVHKLRQNIRESKSLRLVIKIYQALTSNNYVKFFKLVKESSFLQACLLHRYFIQIRAAALRIMCKSYSNNTSLPLEDLINILYFEDKDDAYKFCIHYGLECENNCVKLSNKFLIEPEVNFKNNRAINAIEKKLLEPIEQIINGDILKPFEYTPSSSFNENGKLTILPYMIPSDHYEFGTVELNENHEDEILSTILSEVIYEDLQTLIEILINETKDNESSISNARISICSEIITSTTEIYIRELCERSKNEEIEICLREKAEISVIKHNFSKNYVETISNEIIRTMTNEIASEELNIAKRIWQETFFAEFSNKLRNNLVASVLDEDVKYICSEQLKEAVYERKKVLISSLNLIILKDKQKIWNLWKQKLDLKGNISTFPPAPPFQTISKQLERIGSDISYTKNGMLSCQSLLLTNKNYQEINKAEINTIEFLDKTINDISANDLEFWRPFNLKTIIRHVSANTSSNHVYCKLLLCIPIQEKNVYFSEWVKRKFSIGSISDNSLNTKQSKLLALYSTSFENKKVTFCIRTLEGKYCGDDCKIFRGTSAVIFCSDSEDPLFATRRFQNFCTLPIDRNVPVLFLFTEFLQFNCINPFSTCHVEILPWNNQHEVLITLDNVMEWLALRHPVQNNLKLVYICDYISDFLNKEYFYYVFKDLSKRRKLNRLDRGPQILIEFYNDLLTTILEDLSNVDCSFWPFFELSEEKRKSCYHLNNIENLPELKKMIHALSLPTFEFSNENTEFWNDIAKDVFYFLDSMTFDSIVNCSLLYTRLNRLLNKTKVAFEENILCESQMPLLILPWTEIVAECIYFQLQNLRAIAYNKMVFIDQYKIKRKKLPSFLIDAELLDSDLNVTFQNTIDRSLKRKNMCSVICVENKKKFVEQYEINNSILDTSRSIDVLKENIEEEKNELSICELSLENALFTKDTTNKKVTFDSLEEGLQLLNSSLLSEKNADKNYDCLLNRIL